MLPSIHYQAYEKLLAELKHLQSKASNKFIAGDLLENFSLVQKLFQSDLVNLNSEELNPDLMAKWQSLHTEIYRAFKLLETEMMFLRSSRQPKTIAARLTTIQGRIDQLIAYINAILKL